MLCNRTGLQPGLGIAADILRGEIFVGPATKTIDPLPTFEDEVTSSALGLALIDDYFKLQGFNQIELDPFTVSVRSAIGPAPVPLPASVAMLFFGLVGFGVMRLRTS